MVENQQPMTRYKDAYKSFHQVESSRYIDPSDTDLLMQDVVAFAQSINLVSTEACGMAVAES